MPVRVAVAPIQRRLVARAARAVKAVRRSLAAASLALVGGWISSINSTPRAFTEPAVRTSFIPWNGWSLLTRYIVYHHDGPFDALNPHRNRSSRKNAPMQAFPKDSLNNSLGGAGPLNSQADHSALMGTNTEEAFRDFAGSARNKDGSSKGPDAPIFNPIQGVDMVHGDESVGLGTSTFLEGTPAARTAIHRHREEQAREVMEGGLQRKKSLAQRIRRVGGGQREARDPNFSYRSPETTSAGTESNPFFSEYGRGEDVISVPNRDGALSPTSPPPVPRRDSNGAPLERRATTDATTTLGEDGGKPTGFIGRMKSLKGGRRPKGSNEVTTPPPNPGSAM